MLKDGHDLPLRSVVGGKLVGVMTRGGRICFFSSLRSSCLAACLSRRRWALDQNVEDDAGLVHGSPQTMLHPGNFARDLMKMPFVANPGKAATDLIGEPLAEFACPLPHGFVADDDAQPEREAEVEPDGMADDLGREAIPGVAGANGV